MIVYLAFISILFILGISQVKNKTILRLFLLGYILIAALRGISVGTDTKSYALDYSEMGSMSLGMILKEHTTSFGYYSFAKFFNAIGFDFRAWITLIALVYGVSICCLLKHYAKNPFLSILLFFALGFFAFSLAGLKQVMAMSFVNFSIYYYKERKYKKFLFLGLFACIFHVTALIPLAVLIMLRWIKRDTTKVGVVVCLALSLVVFRDVLFKIGFDFLNDIDSHYAIYGTNNESVYTYTTLIVQIVMLIYLLLFDRRDKFGIIMLTFACVFQFYASGEGGISALFRISMYFNTYSIISIGNSILKSIKTENPMVRSLDEEQTSVLQNPFIYYVIICVLLVVYFTFSTMRADGIYPYAFFWE